MSEWPNVEGFPRERKNTFWKSSKNKKYLEGIKKREGLNGHRIIKTKTLSGETVYVLTA